jgi:hypothetical protein
MRRIAVARLDPRRSRLAQGVADAWPVPFCVRLENANGAPLSATLT